jgi:hypothetical protein
MAGGVWDILGKARTAVDRLLKTKGLSAEVKKEAEECAKAIDAAAEMYLKKKNKAKDSLKKLDNALDKVAKLLGPPAPNVPEALKTIKEAKTTATATSTEIVKKG